MNFIIANKLSLGLFSVYYSAVFGTTYSYLRTQQYIHSPSLSSRYEQVYRDKYNATKLPLDIIVSLGAPVALPILCPFAAVHEFLSHMSLR